MDEKPNSHEGREEASYPAQKSYYDEEYVSSLRWAVSAYYELLYGSRIQRAIQLLASDGLGYNSVPHEPSEIREIVTGKKDRNTTEEENLQYHLAMMDLVVIANHNLCRRD